MRVEWGCQQSHVYIHFTSPSGPGPPQKPGGTLEAQLLSYSVMVILKTYGHMHGNIWKHIWQREPHALVTLAKRLCVFLEAAMQAAAMLGAVWRPKNFTTFHEKQGIFAKKYDA